jgi:cyclophilin family peptidyl-prolyl cis-trans isomerase
MRTRVALVVALILAASGAGACGGGREDSTAEAAPDSAAEPTHPLLDLAAMRDTAPPTFRVRMETTAGPLVIEVHRDWSPRGVDRFYNLVQAGYYDSVYVHRVIPSVIAQFGFYRDPRINQVWLQRPVGDDPVIGRTNARGTITFAHSGMNTRTAQVFINLKDNPQFDDDEFVPFGEVIEGMENADKFYDGYGELQPEGNGPNPGQAAFRGNAYLAEGFPELSQILSATIVDDPGAPPR